MDGDHEYMPKAKLISAGYQVDMETLMKKFHETNSLRFVDFAKCWREMRMSLIFCGFTKRVELLEFVEECCIITSGELSESNDVSRRVAALYLLYSLHFKQPMNVKSPIRVTIKMYAEIKSLIEFARANGHYDIFYCWRKLVTGGSIEQVHALRLYGPAYIRGSKLLPGFVRSTNELAHELSDEVQPQLDELSQIHSQYMEMKRAIKDSGYNGQVEMLGCITDNILSDFKKRLSLFTEAYTTQPLNQLAVTNEAEDIGAKRRKLRNRPMQSS